jgi:hypothetical protein
MDATIEPTRTLFSNKTEKMTGIEFPYGNLVIVSGCFSLNEIRIIQNDPNILASNLPYELLTTDERYIANSGYYKGDETNSDNFRIFCYHQLTHPMLSRWVAVYNERGFGTPKNCMDNCMNVAGRLVSTLASRRDLFDTIGR